MVNEFCIEWPRSSKTATVTAPNNTSIKNKIVRLAQEKPEDVQIIAENEDGSILAHVPIKYVKISPPRQISEEDRERLRMQLEKARLEAKEDLV